MSELVMCEKSLPREEFNSILQLWKEDKIRYFSLTTGDNIFNSNVEDDEDQLYDSHISQLIMYEVVDNTIFIRLHIISMLDCPYNYLMLLSKIVESEFPDIPYGSDMVIYGCEFHSENTLKVFLGEEQLTDEEIISKFPWPLDQDKYRFYKFDYKYLNLKETYTQIMSKNILLLTKINNYRSD